LPPAAYPSSVRRNHPVSRDRVPDLRRDLPAAVFVAFQTKSHVARLGDRALNRANEVTHLGARPLLEYLSEHVTAHAPELLVAQMLLPECLDLGPTAGTTHVEKQEALIAGTRQQEGVVGVESRQRLRISLLMSLDVAIEKLIHRVPLDREMRGAAIRPMVPINRSQSVRFIFSSFDRLRPHIPERSRPPREATRRYAWEDTTTGEESSLSTSAVIFPRQMRPYILKSPSNDQSGYRNVAGRFFSMKKCPIQARP
jgi:hypothetical protein